MSRGFRDAALARTMAALVAISPCAGSRGGSAVMAEKSSGTVEAPNCTAMNKVMIATNATAVMTRLKVSVANTPR